MLLTILFTACDTNKVTQNDSRPVDTASPADTGADTGIENPTSDGSYEFFRDGENTVSYSGQTFRLALISELDQWMETRQDAIEAETYTPSSAESAIDDIRFFLEFDSSIGGSLPITFVNNALQSTFDDISSGKNIIEKLAGNDANTDHSSWNNGSFKGWSEQCSTEPGLHPCTPTSLIETWTSWYSDRVLSELNGPSIGPVGEYKNSAITPSGYHLQELMVSFLTVGVAYSQAMDDYLDSDTEGKGLKADHSEKVAGKNYTALEHAWDEAFGYFGVSRVIAEYEPGMVETGTHIDSNADGLIDIKSEYTWNLNLNQVLNQLQGAQEIYTQFHQGRALIAEQELGELSSDTMIELEAIRDSLSSQWELTLLTSLMNGIEIYQEHIQDFNTSEYSFEQHAKDWGRLKGTALGLQFNPRSKLTPDEFQTLHTLIGSAPVLPTSDETSIQDKVENLETAYEILEAASQ